MRIILAVCLLVGGVQASLQLNMTIMSQNENLSVPLLNYFNYSLVYSDFQIDYNRSQPTNIGSYFELPILPQLQNITTLQMTSKSNATLGNRNVIRTITIPTQPIKLFLVENGLLFLARFDDKMDGSQANSVQYFNLSMYLGKTLNCTDFALDPVQYLLYVECYDRTNEYFNVKMLLVRDVNAIVDNMTINGSRSTTAKNTLKCKERKVIYIDNMKLGSQQVKDSILVYCPYSKRQTDNTPKALAFSANLTNQTYISISVVNKTDQACFQESELIHSYDKGLLMVTRKTIYRYGDTCEPNPFITYDDQFRLLQVGAANFLKDLYVLTAGFLYIKYPGLVNAEVIDIGEPGLEPQGFSVTKHYIYMQVGNASISKLKIYKLMTGLPKLIFETQLLSSEVVSDTGNYYANADYFYLFDQYNNILAVMYYRGATLSIRHKILTEPVLSKNPTYLLCVANKNQSLFILLTVWPFNDKSLQIDYGGLREEFQQKVININLRKHVKGPLVHFYPADESLTEGTYFTGLTLIKLEDSVLNDDILQNLLGVRLEEGIEGTAIKFIFWSYQTIFFLTCDLGYNQQESRVLPMNCNHYLNVIIEQKFIKLEELRKLEILAGFSKPVYLLYDDKYIVLCNEQNQCYPKSFGLNETSKIEEIKLTNSAVPELLLLTYDLITSDRKLRVFDVGTLDQPDQTSTMRPLLEIGKDKITELGNPGVFIRDFQSDFSYSQIIAILTSTSRLYIVQKQRTNSSMPFLCHVTYVLNCSTIKNCVSFDNFFLLSEPSRQKFVLLMTQQVKASHESEPHSRTVMYEYVIENPFDIRQAREYPFLDYTVIQPAKHFSDGQYVYIAVTRKNESCYLIYDSKESSANVLSYRITLRNSVNPQVLLGQLNNQTVHPGLGIIDCYFYSVSNSTFITKLEDQNEHSITLAVKNDNDELLLFNYSVTIDLTSSKVQYSGIIPTLNFSEGVRTNELVLSLDKLSGPIADIDITDSCNFSDILRTDLIQPDRCIAYYSREYGELVSFSSLVLLDEVEVVLTVQYLLCIKQRKVITKLGWHNNCTFRQFSEELEDNSTEKLIMLCMDSDANFMRLLEVDQDCSINVVDIDFNIEIRYYDIQASFPYIMVEVPILLPQNKDYYVCVFEPKSRSVDNCTSLVLGRQSNFMSIDFDIRNRYAIILENGLVVYDMQQQSTNKSLNASRWVSVAELSEIGIDGPFSYLQIVSFFESGLRVQIGTQSESFEVAMQGGATPFQNLSIRFQYKKYIECEYNKESKPKYHKNFVIKTCRSKPVVNYLLANLMPVYTKMPKKYIQVYHRAGSSSWPISMEAIYVTQEFAVSGEYLVVNSVSNLLCYYRLNNEIRWRIDMDPEYKQTNSTNCSEQISIYNDFDSKNYQLKLNFEGISSGSSRASWGIHIPFGICIVISTLFMWKELRWQHQLKLRKKRALRKRRSNSKIHFFSNDFETNLRKIESQKRIN